MHRATENLKATGRNYHAANRRLRWHLHRYGRVPISLMRRVGKARAAYLAAIPGRSDRGGSR